MNIVPPETASSWLDQQLAVLNWCAGILPPAVGLLLLVALIGVVWLAWGETGRKLHLPRRRRARGFAA